MSIDEIKAAHTVLVTLGQRSYRIAIGRDLIDSLGDVTHELRPGAAVCIVTDENVAPHHLPRARAALERNKIRVETIVAPAGEQSKCFSVFQGVCEGLLAAKIERNDLVIALGGGVVGDLAGFAAASVRRGVDIIQAPTTLLAQVDSSVGGKTGINSAYGKNLIGAFHQPIFVLADTAMLDTLPKRVFRAGYAEIVKYGLINDSGFFAWLDENTDALFKGGKVLEQAIAVSCRSKASIVGRDERETGERALLNLGHTFGHALEAAAGFSDTLLHGEAVALGMALAFEFSVRRGLAPMEDAIRVSAHLTKVGLPTQLSDLKGVALEANKLMDLIAQDKKVSRGQLTFILVRGIGQAYVEKAVESADVLAFLEEKLKS